VGEAFPNREASLVVYGACVHYSTFFVHKIRTINKIPERGANGTETKQEKHASCLVLSQNLYKVHPKDKAPQMMFITAGLCVCVCVCVCVYLVCASLHSAKIRPGHLRRDLARSINLALVESPRSALHGQSPFSLEFCRCSNSLLLVLFCLTDFIAIIQRHGH
jgi:hypothetical protein